MLNAKNSKIGTAAVIAPPLNWARMDRAGLGACDPVPDGRGYGLHTDHLTTGDRLLTVTTSLQESAGEDMMALYSSRRHDFGARDAA